MSKKVATRWHELVTMLGESSHNLAFLDNPVYIKPPCMALNFNFQIFPPRRAPPLAEHGFVVRAELGLQLAHALGDAARIRRLRRLCQSQNYYR